MYTFPMLLIILLFLLSSSLPVFQMYVKHSTQLCPHYPLAPLWPHSHLSVNLLQQSSNPDSYPSTTADTVISFLKLICWALVRQHDLERPCDLWWRLPDSSLAKYLIVSVPQGSLPSHCLSLPELYDSWLQPSSPRDTILKPQSPSCS